MLCFALHRRYLVLEPGKKMYGATEDYDNMLPAGPEVFADHTPASDNDSDACSDVDL